MNNVGKLRDDLANVEMIGSSWKEAHRLERIDMTISMIKRISTPIEIWEHRLGKGMESTFDFEATQITHLKTKQGLACKIRRNKHMIEISSEVFVVGPTRARSYSTIMYKAVHMTYEASPSRQSHGLFKTQRDHLKPTVDRWSTRRRTPISYHTSIGNIS